jgi:hypothetical protein
MPPTFIRLAVSRKNGTAIRMNELYDLKVSLKRIIGESRGSKMITGRQARPRAKAIGTRTAIRKKNTPNRISAAIDGEKMPPPLMGPPAGRAPGCAGWRGSARRGTPPR